MSSKDKTTDASSNSPVCKFWPTLSEFCQDWTLELSFSYIISFEMPSSLLPTRGSLSLAVASNKPNCVVCRCVSWILYLIRSDQISRSVVSDSLWPHESQHSRPPCPSPTPGVHPDSRPLSQWCHPAALVNVVLESPLNHQNFIL